MSHFKYPFKRTFNRKRLRLPGYDYTKPGLYFVTIDCKNMECRFGAIVKQEMKLSDFGKIAYDEWLKLPYRFSHVQLDVFQIMPNHIHAIIKLNECLGSGDGLKNAVASPIKICEDLSNTGEGLNNAGASPANTDPNTGTSKSHVKVGLAPTFGNILCSPISNKPLFDIIGSYKSIVANACLDLHKNIHAGKKGVPLLGKIWHRSFFDHIIRDKWAYKSISRYILNNPKHWVRDKFYRG